MPLAPLPSPPLLPVLAEPLTLGELLVALLEDAGGEFAVTVTGVLVSPPGTATATDAL
jgi:hypothetical protein